MHSICVTFFLIIDLIILGEIHHLASISADAVFKDSLLLKATLTKKYFSSTEMVLNWDRELCS